MAFSPISQLQPVPGVANGVAQLQQIVPLVRPQPFAGDPGEAARLATQRVNQLSPVTLPSGSVVPVGQGAPLSVNAIMQLRQAQRLGPPAQIARTPQEDFRQQRRVSRAQRVAQILASRNPAPTGL